MACFIPPQVCSSCLIVGIGHGLRFIVWFSWQKLLTTQIVFSFFGTPKVGDTQLVSSYVFSRTPCLYMLSNAGLNTSLYASGTEYDLSCHKMVVRLLSVESLLLVLWMFLTYLEKCPQILWVYYLTVLFCFNSNGSYLHGWLLRLNYTYDMHYLSMLLLFVHWLHVGCQKWAHLI